MVAPVVKHATLATGTDAGTGEIHKAEWNEQHTFTVSQASLLGASAAGNIAEITLGTGLSFAAGALTLDADLQTYAGITPSANIQTFLGAADYAAMRTQLGLVIGTNVQAYDADLTTWAGLTPSAFFQTLVDDADAATARTTLGLVIGTNVQAYDADLTTWAGITPAANVGTFLATPTSANLAAALTDENGSGKVIFSAGTLDIASGKTLTASNTLTFTGTDSSSVAFGTGGTVLYSADLYTTAYSSAMNGVTTKALAPDVVYDKFESFLRNGFVSANFYVLTGGINGIQAGSTQAVNRIYYHPFVLPSAVTLSDLGFYCATAVASANSAIAIYAHSASTGLPTGTPLAATGNIATATTGAKSGDITGANVALAAGIYWAATWSDSACAFTCKTPTSVTPHAFITGSATLGNVLSGSNTSVDGVYSDETYNASAWPNAASESFTELVGSSRVAVIVGKMA